MLFSKINVEGPPEATQGATAHAQGHSGEATSIAKRVYYTHRFGDKALQDTFSQWAVVQQS